MNKINLDKIKDAIKTIEDGSVYRCQVLDTDGSGMWTSTNGMPTEHWNAKKILQLAKIVKNKPEGMA